MSDNILYHGSNVIVQNPKVLINGYYKDFGYGFYCTNLEKQARRWAFTRKDNTVINKYNYIKNENLKVCTFLNMSEEWLQFVVEKRSQFIGYCKPVKTR